MAVKAESAMPYEATSPEALFSLLITILAIGEFYASIQTLGCFYYEKRHWNNGWYLYWHHCFIKLEILTIKI